MVEQLALYAAGSYPFRFGVVADVGFTINSTTTLRNLYNDEPDAFTLGEQQRALKHAAAGMHGVHGHSPAALCGLLKQTMEAYICNMLCAACAILQRTDLGITPSEANLGCRVSAVCQIAEHLCLQWVTGSTLTSTGLMVRLASLFGQQAGRSMACCLLCYAAHLRF